MCRQIEQEVEFTVGLPRHRHIVGFFNVPVPAPATGHPILLLFRDSKGMITHRFILYTTAAIAIPNTMHKDTLLSEAVNGKLVSVTDASLSVDFSAPFPVQNKYK